MPDPASQDIDELWRKKLAQGIPCDEDALAAYALQQVSRTFALNIRVLPQPLHRQILYAYLFCRMADTLEDDSRLHGDEKAALLSGFSGLFAESLDATLFEDRWKAFQSALPDTFRSETHWEPLLLLHGDRFIRAFRGFPDQVRQVIGHCVSEMCKGMAQFALKQEGAAQGKGLIRTLQELDDYCYYVAGTVGVLLCDLFVRHSRYIRGETARGLKSLCISFGLGLQLTNILKDVHEDRERDVSWLPGDLLGEENMTARDFHDPAKSVQARRVFARLLSKAKGHLEDALEYSCLLPRVERRMRLFCLWPLFMAAETLALLGESAESLVQGARLKISRDQVKSIMRKTALMGWSNRWVRREFQKPIGRLDHALQKLGKA
jgi:farnesyl-diphosphate farnesyltransferase